MVGPGWMWTPQGQQVSLELVCVCMPGQHAMLLTAAACHMAGADSTELKVSLVFHQSPCDMYVSHTHDASSFCVACASVASDACPGVVLLQALLMASTGV